MWKSLVLTLILAVGAISSVNGQQTASATRPRVVCYYDSRSSLKDGKKLFYD